MSALLWQLGGLYQLAVIHALVLLALETFGASQDGTGPNE